MTQEEIKQQIKKEVQEGLDDFNKKNEGEWKAYLVSDIEVEEVKNAKKIQRKTSRRDS